MKFIFAGAASILILGLGLHLVLLDGLPGTVLSLVRPTETHFAAGYSDWGFRRVKAGASMDEVRALLGEPLMIYRMLDQEERRESWAYSLRDSAAASYQHRAVIFDADGLVFEKGAQLVGPDPGEMSMAGERHRGGPE